MANNSSAEGGKTSEKDESSHNMVLQRTNSLAQDSSVVDYLANENGGHQSYGNSQNVESAMDQNITFGPEGLHNKTDGYENKENGESNDDNNDKNVSGSGNSSGDANVYASGEGNGTGNSHDNGSLKVDSNGDNDNGSLNVDSNGDGSDNGSRVGNGDCDPNVSASADGNGGNSGDGSGGDSSVNVDDGGDDLGNGDSNGNLNGSVNVDGNGGGKDSGNISGDNDAKGTTTEITNKGRFPDICLAEEDGKVTHKIADNVKQGLNQNSIKESKLNTLKNENATDVEIPPHENITDDSDEKTSTEVQNGGSSLDTYKDVQDIGRLQNELEKMESAMEVKKQNHQVNDEDLESEMICQDIGRQESDSLVTKFDNTLTGKLIGDVRTEGLAIHREYRDHRSVLNMVYPITDASDERVEQERTDSSEQSTTTTKISNGESLKEKGIMEQDTDIQSNYTELKLGIEQQGTQCKFKKVIRGCRNAGKGSNEGGTENLRYSDEAKHLLEESETSKIKLDATSKYLVSTHSNLDSNASAIREENASMIGEEFGDSFGINSQVVDRKECGAEAVYNVVKEKGMEDESTMIEMFMRSDSSDLKCEENPKEKALRYLEENGILRMFQNLAAGIVHDRPEKPLTYMINVLEQEKKDD